MVDQWIKRLEGAPWFSEDLPAAPRADKWDAVRLLSPAPSLAGSDAQERSDLIGLAIESRDDEGCRTLHGCLYLRNSLLAAAGALRALKPLI
jgi:hypothetical protein